MVKLTRYLYILDEVCFTLISRLLNKNRSFDEIIFWVCELFYSGNLAELKNLAYYYYYNFCAINYPKFEKKINVLLNKNDLKSILTCFNLLHTSKSNFKVFKKFILNPTHINKIYLFKNIPFIKKLNIDEKYYKIIISIHKQNYTNICYYLKNNTYPDTNGLYNAIKVYYTKVKKLKLSNKKLESIHYKNKNHMILALICYLEEDIENIEKRRIFKKFDYKKYLDLIKRFETPKKNDYKTLKSKAEYDIEPTIGCFKLERFKLENIRNQIRMNWIYYCYDEPIWKKRLAGYDLKLNKTKKTLEFRNEDEEEEFHETYDLEFDEQANEVQNSINPIINKCSFQKWMSSV